MQKLGHKVHNFQAKIEVKTANSSDKSPSSSSEDEAEDE